MNTMVITGEDTLVLFGRVIQDLTFDDTCTITFPNELASMKTGKNANTIYSFNEQGNNCDLQIKVIRGSSDDIFLNSKLSDQKRLKTAMTLAEGSFIKKLGDGQGNVLNDKYTLKGGMFANGVDGKENTSGETTQGESIYKMKFASAVRGLE